MNATHRDARRCDLTFDIDAPPEAVWRALTEAEELVRWFPPVAEVTPGVGGTVRWNWRDHHDWNQRITVWEPGRRLVTEYDSAVEGDDGRPVPLFIDFAIEGRSGGTTLRMVHSGFGPDASFDDEYDGISRGWPVELRSLKLYCERHVGRDRRLVWAEATTDVPGRDAWTRLAHAVGVDPGLDALAEGASFSFTTPGGDAFEGTALCCHDRQFSGVVRNRDDAFMRLAAEEWGGKTHVWMWLATYGDTPDPALRALESRWSEALRETFGASA